MGVFSPTIYGNDLAEDLKGEYSVAFAYYDVEKALEAIEEYVIKEYDLSDEYELCDYVYSLADFMWKKGILTEDVKQRALHLIDSNVALEEWEQAGKKELNARLKVLKELKDRLLSPLPPKKKITIKYYTKPIFEVGNVIVIKLKTLDKIYNPTLNLSLKNISQEEFNSYNDKYIALLKINDCVSYISSIVPEVRDIYPQFKLYNKIFNDVPKSEEIKLLDFVEVKENCGGVNFIRNIFTTEGNLSHFIKRDYIILGNDERVTYSSGLDVMLLLGLNKPFANVDSELISYIKKKNKKNS